MAMEKHTYKVKAIVTVKLTVGGFLKNIGVGQVLDNISDFLRGNALSLELVSKELDPRTPGLEKQPIKAAAAKELGLNLILSRQELEETQYEANFDVPKDFGEIGAVLVTNEHRKEMFLKNIVFDSPTGKFTIDCESWIHSKYDNPEKRIFFIQKSYLPSQTPDGLKMLRIKELENLRGNGKGERKNYDRIYDYDTYNDLGDPDSTDSTSDRQELTRPVLGGKDRPYPRRCRTGRPKSAKDSSSETRSAVVYVPRDENFADTKAVTFGISVLNNVLHALIPTLEATVADKDMGFDSFKQVNDLYQNGIELPPLEDQKEMRAILPGLLESSLTDSGKDVLRFETPDLFERDEYAWLRDEEFARETLAGLNPYSIKLVTEWPLMSKLDPAVYGPPESAITSQIIQQEIKEITVQEAISLKKLYMLDYHDVLLPYANRVNEVKGTVLYGSRTIFYLTSKGTLKPLAIELTRPLPKFWKRVYTPSDWDGTGSWLWRMAKAHVLTHDSAYHELISHWLRTHCCTEPYVIATNRQLSKMHPVHRLLEPHFRYTMEINALAREALINADGIIETTFSARKYCMELSSAIYDQEWRFDLQGLPADLIARGMAVEEEEDVVITNIVNSGQNGRIKLLIEDYPFASDGLLLWDAIKQWVTDYVNHYYYYYYHQYPPNPNLLQQQQQQQEVESDPELQAWWEEIRTVGHGDKKDEPWWPVLKTNQDLIGILTTMIWVSSGHHAAVNFGQYTYAGYFPNRPTIARSKMPDDVDDTAVNVKEEHSASASASASSWNKFLERPEETLLTCFPSKIQATKVMAVLDVLSTHSPDEEYIGERIEPSWAQDDVVSAAFNRFHANLKEIEKTIDQRNADKRFKNRYGAGTVPYELLKPYSKPGVTGMGVPNSISI